MYPNYYETALRRRAKNVGLLLEQGCQRYMHTGWGYVTDERGERIKGYQLFDRDTGRYVPGSYDEIHSHCLTTLDEVWEMIRVVAEDKGIVWY